MRIHRLRDLRIPGSDFALELLPNFDFYRLGQVRNLYLRTNDLQGDAYDFGITALYDDGNKEYIVTINFSEVRMVRLPELAPSFYLSELEIEDVSHDQMEGIRYRAKNHGMTEFEILCKGMEIAKCVPIT